ncbi:hypothetical protein C7M84_019561 [Penaeus vannamei]|uniref:Uncharacterized protein n=1 Tax=Penaeus vannamei TaxID=6689 RepID=A0A3R7LTN0_PENVA|nr:hypothetical protein C7M84_019561 [Penaeus vannamei]
MNPKEPLESLGTPERSSSPEQTRLDTPSPMQGNIDLQALSFISEGSEVLSTPIQPRDADQPPVGVDEMGVNGMGGTSPMSDTEIGPTIEEPPNLTPSLELAQRTPQPQENEPPQVDERNILDISLPFDASLDTAPTPAQEDRIGACHELIDRVVERPTYPLPPRPLRSPPGSEKTSLGQGNKKNTKLGRSGQWEKVQESICRSRNPRERKQGEKDVQRKVCEQEQIQGRTETRGSPKIWAGFGIWESPGVLRTEQGEGSSKSRNKRKLPKGSRSKRRKTVAKRREWAAGLETIVSEEELERVQEESKLLVSRFYCLDSPTGKRSSFTAAQRDALLAHKPSIPHWETSTQWLLCTYKTGRPLTNDLSLSFIRTPSRKAAGYDPFSEEAEDSTQTSGRKFPIFLRYSIPLPFYPTGRSSLGTLLKFDNKCYQQMKGTAIGASVSVAVAEIFVHAKKIAGPLRESINRIWDWVQEKAKDTPWEDRMTGPPPMIAWKKDRTIREDPQKPANPQENGGGRRKTRFSHRMSSTQTAPLLPPPSLPAVPSFGNTRDIHRMSLHHLPPGN